jgi:hypothetical protein
MFASPLGRRRSDLVMTGFVRLALMLLAPGVTAVRRCCPDRINNNLTCHGHVGHLPDCKEEGFELHKAQTSFHVDEECVGELGPDSSLLYVACRPKVLHFVLT